MTGSTLVSSGRIMSSICRGEGLQDRGTPAASSQSVTSLSSFLRASSLARSSVTETSPGTTRVWAALVLVGGFCLGETGTLAWAGTCFCTSPGKPGGAGGAGGAGG